MQGGAETAIFPGLSSSGDIGNQWSTGGANIIRDGLTSRHDKATISYDVTKGTQWLFPGFPFSGNWDLKEWTGEHYFVAVKISPR